MKKIISLILFIFASLSMVYTFSYENWPYDYHIANLLEYLSLWLFVMSILSLFSFVLDDKKHKKWVLMTLIFFISSVLLAYKIGDGTGGIVSIDGELITWFLVGLYSLISIIYFITQFFKNKYNQ